MGSKYDAEWNESTGKGCHKQGVEMSLRSKQKLT